MDFKTRYGPWAVIAGASEGTGREFARRIAAEGVSLILVARRIEPLEALAEEIRAEHGVECEIASVDLGAADAAERIVAAVGPREVGLYINNAGADSNGAGFFGKDVSAWVGLVNMNVTTPLTCCHHFGGPMKARGHGGLLIVNSGACYGGAAGLTAYAGSKAFELVFTEGLWAELHDKGVHVLTLVLGQTDTPAYRALLTERGLPIPTNWASPAEVAKVGLEQLPHGPIHNWGSPNNSAGFAPSSPDDRRARVLAISQHTRALAGGAK